MRIRMTIAYDGTAYAGWQVQPNGVAIQARIEAALATITGATLKLHGSGRTDTGVHARAQVAHCDLPATADLPRLSRGLNALLPPDIRVTALAAAPPDFHARHSALRKEYRYFIYNGEVVPPCLARYRARVTRPLDVGAMQYAAEQLQGVHDFAAFTANPNRKVETTVRHLMRLEVRRRAAEVLIRAEADGFLFRMVRSLAGFLIRVGDGSIAPGTAGAVLASRVRTARVETAPAQGLFLWKVTY